MGQKVKNVLSHASTPPPPISSLQQRLWGKSGEERENTREHCIRNPLQPPNSPWYSSCVCKTASRKMAADGASAGYETTTSAASAGTVPVVRTREVAGVSTAWMSFTTENISFYEPLIAWHCLSKYCNACSWVPNKTPCDLTVARSEPAGSMSWVAQEWTHRHMTQSTLILGVAGVCGDQTRPDTSCVWPESNHVCCILGFCRLLHQAEACRSLCSLLFVLFFSRKMQFGCQPFFSLLSFVFPVVTKLFLVVM